VLDQVITGRINKAIAAELGTVKKTIKAHRARVMEKMKAGSVAEFVRLGERGAIRRVVPGMGHAALSCGL